MEKSSFFNSVLDQNGNPDKPYLAEDYASYFASFIGNGVFPNQSNNLQVMSNNNMTITIKQGKAWINGYFYYNTDNLILPIDIADGVLNRIDRIVLRLDFINREIKVKVKKGTFASSPTAPTLQRDTDAYELALADVAVNKGIISITQGNITDKRLDNNLCGIVHGTVDQVDVTTLFNQYNDKLSQKEVAFEAEFQAWFNSIKGQLSGDVAANLSNQITDINNKLGTEELTTTKKTLTGAVNEVKSSLGEMTTLTTIEKTNLVGAINEVKQNGDKKAQFKNGNSTFPSGQTTFTITDTFITSNTLVTIIPKGEKQGVWSGVANNGNFVITSDTAETNAVPFDWGGVK